MSNTHGVIWTENEILARIMEVVNNTEIGRMPSRKEIHDYYKNDRLTNAISKKHGYAYYAEKLNLSAKESETYFGKKQEVIAFEELVSQGYEVRRMPQNFPYDLLVDDCIKIDVKCSRLYKGTGGNFYSFNLEKPYCTCDLYLLYLLNDDRSVKDILVIPSKLVATNTQIGVGEKKSKYLQYSRRWDIVSQYAEAFQKIS